MTTVAPALDATHAVAPPDAHTLDRVEVATERIRSASPVGPGAVTVRGRRYA